MLFAKKKNLKFEEMEHIESPNLSELEATLDFLKKTPEKKDDEESGKVLNPMPAIEPPKLDAEKRVSGSDEAGDGSSSSMAQDISFEDENSGETSNEAAKGLSGVDKKDGNAVSAEIIKKAEALKEKQLINDTVNTEAELALKKDESNITKTSDDVNSEPPKEISDAVKAAMALQAEYEAKKKDMPEEDTRKMSRFMRSRAFPVKKTAAPDAEQEKNAQGESGQKNESQAENAAEKKDENSDEKVEKSDTVTAEKENASQPLDENKTATNDEKPDKAEVTGKTETVGDDENDLLSAAKDDIEKTADNELTETAQDVKFEDTKPEIVNAADDESQKEVAVKETAPAETAALKKPTPMKSSSSTAITSNLRLPNDVIVSNIESSARSMGKYVGAAKIANPLPHPKKHITRNMDFDYPVSAAQMHFDIEDLNGMDFFDIDD